MLYHEGHFISFQKAVGLISERTLRVLQSLLQNVQEKEYICTYVHKESKLI